MEPRHFKLYAALKRSSLWETAYRDKYYTLMRRLKTTSPVKARSTLSSPEGWTPASAFIDPMRDRARFAGYADDLGPSAPPELPR